MIDTMLFLREDRTLWGAGYLHSIDGDSNAKFLESLSADTNWQDIELGTNHILATKTDGTLWAWGSNLSGQLGLGFFGYRTTPQKIVFTE